MKQWKRVGMVMLVVVLAFGVVSSVSAQGPDRGKRAQQARDRIGVAVLEAAVEATGLEQSELVDALRSGSSINDILAENGIDTQVVVDVVMQVVTDEINAAVADGKITQENADRVLEALPDRLAAAMDRSRSELPIRERFGERFDSTLVGIIAEAAGVETGEFLREAFTPPTLAEVAAEYGLDVDALIATAEARITEEVDQALADGKITEEQAATLLDGLHDRLVERFNQPFLRPLRDWFERQQSGPGGRSMPGRPGRFGGFNGQGAPVGPLT